MKKLIIILLIIIQESAIAHEFTVTSNYVWRGVSQSGDRAAVQGEIAKEFSTGSEVSIWGSSLDGNGQEIDFVLAQNFSLGDFVFSLGSIYYYYNRIPDGDYLEIYATGSWQSFKLEFYHGVDHEVLSYVNFAYSYPLIHDSQISLSLGHSNFRQSSESNSYFDWGLSYSFYWHKSETLAQLITFGWTNTLNKEESDNLSIGSSWKF